MRNCRGMTLIEMILTIALAAVLVTGMVIFTRTEVERMTYARDFIIASNLTRLEMAKMNNTDYSALPPGVVVLPQEPSFPGFMSQRTITQITNPFRNLAALRQVEIRTVPVTGSFSNPLASLITYRESVTTFGDGI